MKTRRSRLGVLLVLLTVLIISSCTDNTMAKSFGGTEIIKLPIDTKFQNITWKGDEIWYVTRKMRAEEKSEVYKFHEKSKFGMLESTIIIKESKTKVIKDERLTIERFQDTF